jgi:hypothetical protein
MIREGFSSPLLLFFCVCGSVGLCSPMEQHAQALVAYGKTESNAFLFEGGNHSDKSARLHLWSRAQFGIVYCMPKRSHAGVTNVKSGGAHRQLP